MGSGTTRLDDEHLADYLNEHLLASEGGLRAFKAAADTWAGTPHERTLHALVGEIERDRHDLAQLIQRLGYRPTGWKRALTLAFATVGRANPVNLLRRTGGSMAQLELDVLTGAVRAKRSMWDTLLEIAGDEPRLDPRLLHDLAARADQQIGELQNISRATCRDRFLETA
ncbi:hypothetical protein SAMN04487783_1541 [Agrococcus baldri]|uniref:Uncharacterized protein n=1 Tax=Agrococcus baldri TaxID=153730 RepID=A0AA94HMJ5_9MICO|nr:hypothetical protein [Agrococcus baldri]SFS11240.1 hypothetical protein SAMN04487783_1541 [Agrococcus baldri]